MYDSAWLLEGVLKPRPDVGAHAEQAMRANRKRGNLGLHHGRTCVTMRQSLFSFDNVLVDARAGACAFWKKNVVFPRFWRGRIGHLAASLSTCSMRKGSQRRQCRSIVSSSITFHTSLALKKQSRIQGAGRNRHRRNSAAVAGGQDFSTDQKAGSALPW